MRQRMTHISRMMHILLLCMTLNVIPFVYAKPITPEKNIQPFFFFDTLDKNQQTPLVKKWDQYLLAHKNINAHDYSALVSSTLDNLNILIDTINQQELACKADASFNKAWFKEFAHYADLTKERITVIFLLKGILFEQRQHYLESYYDDLLLAESQLSEITRLWFIDFDKFLTQLQENSVTVLSLKQNVSDRLADLNPTKFSQPLQTEWAQNQLFQAQKQIMKEPYVKALYQSLQGKGCFDLLEVIAPLNAMVLPK